MSGEIVVSETPNWLNDLEAKREQRLKVKLGHEAGAGAPCLKCAEKCPGLDLHFWRKACKVCRCPKEDHDVPDDDIYGWAQFQLLGSKPNKIKTKIVLPGKNDEVELEWAPKGQKDTVEKYLKSLPTNNLPIKGSQAAQERKQLLQKQIPVHDIDPTLCHELNDEEVMKMEEYIADVKKSSVGVGQIVNLSNIIKANIHNISPQDAHIIASRYSTGVPFSEIVKLQCGLAQNLEKMTMQQGREKTKDQSPASLLSMAPNQILADNIVEQNVQAALPSSKYKDIEHYQCSNHKLGGIAPQYAQKLQGKPIEREGRLGFGTKEQQSDGTHFDPSKTPGQFLRHGLLPNQGPTYKYKFENPCFNRDEKPFQKSSSGPGQSQSPESVKDLIYGTYDLNQASITPDENPSSFHSYNNVEPNVLKQQKMLKALKPTNLNVSEFNLQPNVVNIGAIKDVNPEIRAAITPLNHGNDDDGKYIPSEYSPDSIKEILNNIQLPECHYCKKAFEENEFAVSIERSNALFHAQCFRCAGCNQNLADNIYFYDKESDNVYCGRDYAKIKGYPRCTACDELIFTKEYCLAENATFHLKHFCCFRCDSPLAGQDYTLEENKPYCLPCFETAKAATCATCGKIIKTDETGCQLNGVHFHAEDRCFRCIICTMPLMGKKLLLRNEKLYCSHECFNNQI